jgi:hypothetical protein
MAFSEPSPTGNARLPGAFHDDCFRRLLGA